MESLFGKRRINFSNKHEPGINKQVKHEKGSTKVAQQDKPKKKEGPASKIRDNLKGSKFRLLNEFLYTNDSQKAVEYFAENKELFDEYHEGFTQQMKTWPINPLDTIIKELSTNPIFDNKIVCDLGCGEGKLYEYFQERNQIQGVEGNTDEEHETENTEENQKNTFKKILSYDLVSIKDHIVACDIANLPQKDGSVDTCVFCLALMGVNYIDFLLEAHRCLSMGGYLVVAEVMSRIPDKTLFVQLIKSLGFKFVKFIKKNDFFLTFIFKKADNKKRNKNQKVHLESKDNFKSLPKGPKDPRNMTLSEASQLLLLPCIYKRR